MIGNGKSGKEWLSNGLDYSATRFSPLNQIRPPTSGSWARLALSARTRFAASRRRRWWSTASCTNRRHGAWCTRSTPAPASGSGRYDPGVDRALGYKGCCDVVNRGVALYKGKVYVGAYDGRLVAIDAVTGKKVWEADTLIDHTHSYTITGAPRVVKGKVLIGNGGAEYGARGYITAYDAETGKQAWRWYVVPGDPSKPFEDDSMQGGRQDLGSRRSNGGSMAAAARHGIPSPTIPNST